MLKFLLFFTLLISSSCSQNLVPNFSFEVHTGCPVTQGDIVKATPWQTVNGQTPDYFHPCGLAGWYSAPDNSANFGYQLASDGVAYAGIRAWDNFWGPDIREYIGVNLTSPMIACEAYWISFKVCRANGPNTAWATDDIGMYISNWAPTGTEVLSAYVPQIRNPEGSLIADSINWTIISGIYIASGNESYITIGNFETYDNTTIGNGSGSGAAYYYIDEVIVEKYTGPIVDLGADTIVCEGTPVILNVGSSWDFITWQDGSDNNTYTVSSSGLYSVTTYEGFCNYHDTVAVTVQQSPATEIGNDTTLCYGQSLTLSANSPGNYLWNNGSNDATINVSLPGEYWLEIDTGVCSVRDYLTITYTDCVFIPDIFSPNSDGKNDILYVRGMNDLPFEFIIFDRWGQKVFETHESAVGWDGKYKNKDLDGGVFIYCFKTTSPVTGEAFTKKGNITLIR